MAQTTTEVSDAYEREEPNVDVTITVGGMDREAVMDRRAEIERAVLPLLRDESEVERFDAEGEESTMSRDEEVEHDPRLIGDTDVSES